MIGLLFILTVSFLLLKALRIPFSVLGIKPNTSRLKNFLVGLIASALICAVAYILLIELRDYQVNLNKDYTIPDFLYGCWWIFRSVLWEELLFRGALLVLAIKYLGKHNACILSSFIFGIYHWFSYDVFGSLVPMLYTFTVTGIGGLMFAYAFAETRSIYLPIALHFGCNLLTISIFSEGPLGEQLLVVTGGKPMGYLYFPFLFNEILILPVFTFFYLKYLRKHTKPEMNFNSYSSK
ncbi:CPBP family intramembrane metalloprotease [Gramella lutea]|uniref:CPBP family intramembrane metalloprotease n=1 Tax=Christiangramia lutea TaxID=1607951 RepID=A0A9X2ABP6_9FLAO|nr:CPBP family intramembrane glutamic endopeptidase [Christiangramia lutea]MCH4824441.1 CPBP family intramembrane metalloprotease [Christiangramia lutea]